MPLIKPRKGASKKRKRAIASKNIGAEIRSGRPKKQAIAIGLSVAGLSRKKRKSGKKKK